MGNYMDFHMHSCFSGDGCYTPEELADLCEQAGLRAVALTDHNSIGGVAQMMDACAARSIEAVPAIELDCLYQHYQLHVLGYGIDHTLPQWRAVEQRVIAMETKAGNQYIQRFHDLGIFFEDHLVLALARQQPVNAEMIAEIALADPRNNAHPLLAPYRPGGTRADNPCLNIYWDFCTPGGLSFFKVDYQPLDEGLRLIHEAGGIAVLAHPGQSVGRDEAAIRDILAHGFQGLETHCSYHDADDAAYFTNLAQQAGVLCTVGSDFHGKTKPNVRLGQPECPDLEQRWQALKATLASAASA